MNLLDTSHSQGIDVLVNAVAAPRSSDDVAIGALKAVTRFNLQENQWIGVALGTWHLLYRMRDMDSKSRGEVIATAVQVPVEEIRSRMKDLLVPGFDDDLARAETTIFMPGLTLTGTVRIATAYALARAGDAEALPVLLQAAKSTDDNESLVAAHGLTMLDPDLLDGHREELQTVWDEHAVGEDIQLLVAIALARAGVMEPLEETMERIAAAGAKPFSYLLREARRAFVEGCGDLPDQVQDNLVRIIAPMMPPGTGGEIWDVVNALGQVRYVPAPPPPPTEAPTGTSYVAHYQQQQRRPPDAVKRTSPGDDPEVFHRTVEQANSAPERMYELINFARDVQFKPAGGNPNARRLFDESRNIDAGVTGWLASKADIYDVVDELAQVVDSPDDPAEAVRAARVIEGAAVHAEEPHGVGPGLIMRLATPPQAVLHMPMATAPPRMEEAAPPSAEDAALKFDDDTHFTRAKPPEPMPPPPTASTEDRRVQTQILRNDAEHRTFLAGAGNLVRCWIGLDRDTDLRERGVSDTAIPAVDIPAEGLSLDVKLRWGDGPIVSGNLTLPRGTGTSNECDLLLPVPAGERFPRATLTFLYKGRVFEEVTIEARVIASEDQERDDDRIDILVRLSAREVLDFSARSEVDASITQTDEGLVVFGRAGDGDGVYSFENLQGVIDYLNSEIFGTDTQLVSIRIASGQANQPLDVDNEETRKFLVGLAQQGNLLHRSLLDQGYKDPGRSLQLINHAPDKYVPLEFIYDRGNPADDATIKQACLKALAGGLNDCPDCVPAADLSDDERDLGTTVCPYGFWALQKVIERFTKDAGQKRLDQTQVSDELHVLRPVDNVLYGVSHRVEEGDRDALKLSVDNRFGGALFADTWKDWQKQVQQEPALLLALPHHESERKIDYLEIGASSRLKLGQLLKRYIRRPQPTGTGPIMLLLGCETARTANLGYASFQHAFSQNGAAVVFGTLSKVLGRHAVPLAGEFIEQLTAQRDEATSLGELLLKIRRTMFVRGYLLSLSLVAHGDADWQLPPSGGR